MIGHKPNSPTYGRVWPHVAAYGRCWPHICGRIWLHIWPKMAAYDRIWPDMAAYGGPMGTSGCLRLSCWGLWGSLGQLSLFGDLLVFSAPEKVSVSPQRGASFKRRRFCLLFEFSGTQPPLQQKRAYGRRGATCFNGRTNFRRFQFSADFCVSFVASKKYAYGRRGGHIFKADRTGPSGRNPKPRAFFDENERFA